MQREQEGTASCCSSRGPLEVDTATLGAGDAQLLRHATVQQREPQGLGRQASGVQWLPRAKAQSACQWILQADMLRLSFIISCICA